MSPHRCPLVMLVIACAGASVAARTRGDTINLNPGSQYFFSQTNGVPFIDGYGVGRGVLFTANQAIDLAGVGWEGSFGGGSLTFSLYQIQGTTGTNTLDPGNATLLKTVTQSFADQGMAYYDAFFSSPVTLVAGTHYQLMVSESHNLTQEVFYNFNQDSLAPVNIGAVTIIDGAVGGNTTNTVMPVMRLDTVVTPVPPTAYGGLALLAGVAVVQVRRRRVTNC